MRFAISIPNFGAFGDPALVGQLARDAEDAATCPTTRHAGRMKLPSCKPPA